MSPKIVWLPDSSKTLPAVHSVPLENILLASDAPFLPDYQHSPNVAYNTPWSVIDVAIKVAAVRGCSVHTTMKHSRQNAIDFYGLEEKAKLLL